jgi:hypothetical protein
MEESRYMIKLTPGVQGSKCTKDRPLCRLGLGGRKPWYRAANTIAARPTNLELHNYDDTYHRLCMTELVKDRCSK